MTTTTHTSHRVGRAAASNDGAPFTPEERDALLRMTPAERIADTAHRRADAIAHAIDDERHASLAARVLSLQS
jgi:hypothetical protein